MVLMTDVDMGNLTLVAYKRPQICMEQHWQQAVQPSYSQLHLKSDA
jgi:hypothetical protein